MNKLVLVSGAGRGLGASIAESFIESGYRVAINYSSSKEKAEELSASYEKLASFNCSLPSPSFNF